MLRRRKRRAARLTIMERAPVAVAILFVAQLACLQIGRGSYFRGLADCNRIDTFATPAARGAILDSHLRALAYDAPAYSVMYIASPEHLATPAFLRRLSVCLRLEPAIVKRKIDAARKQVQVMLAAHVSPEVISRVRERQSELPGVMLVPDSVRTYPFGDLASHVIGYINSIPGQLEKQFVERGGFPADAKIGWSGVEKACDDVLRGHPGRIRVEISSTGVSRRILPDSSSAVRGQDVVLTIDADYQNFVQHVLNRQVNWLRKHGRKQIAHAMAVAVNPNTGALYALASVPDYRPDWFVKGISFDVYRRLFAPAEQDWAIQAPVAPGSVMKPLTALYALSRHAIIPGTTVLCEGGWKLPAADGTVLKCWATHGSVDVRTALAESCDVFFYQASLAYGHWPPPPGESVAHWLRDRRLQTLHSLERMQAAFGLGVGTGIDLPGETSGFVNEGSGQLTDLPYTAIGQNEVFTPLELAGYTAMLANGGHPVRPHVVAALRLPDGTSRPLYWRAPAREPLVKLGVTPEDMRLVREGMYMACNSPHGTAYQTFHSGPPLHYTVAGKTGTAETGVQGYDNAVFIGFAPFDRPKIAIVVEIPGGGHGSDSTGPVARALFDRFFAAASRK